MQQDRLWAPWRMDYIDKLVAETGHAKPDPGTGCFLCDDAAATLGLAPGDDRLRERLVLLHDERGVLMLNKYPYCNGHLLIARPEHVPDLEGYTAEQRAGLMELVVLGQALLRDACNPQGINVGINIGRAAGAGVPGHLHIHVVPRWAGDVNFMETVGGVRIIPQALDRTYTLLADVLRQRLG